MLRLMGVVHVKKIAGLLVLFLLVFCATGVYAQKGPKSIGYDEALKLAAEKKQNVMLYFWADWCGYCKMVNDEVLPDPEVSKYLNEKIILVTIKEGKGSAKLEKKYEVRGYPNFVFLNPAGEKVFSFPGFVEAPLFLVVLEYVNSGAYKTTDLETYYEENYADKE